MYFVVNLKIYNQKINIIAIELIYNAYATPAHHKNRRKRN
ncbi:MAG: hypothetical protein JWP67_320 [Mucilaginibacter sp.]|nr:hypothetical protein [Mucilaginibacter sp.]